jgi:delta8-fatty-acid desaturase
VPPIQGGKFKHREDLDEADLHRSNGAEEQDSSSQESSGTSSPIFDAVEYSPTSVRRRIGREVPSDTSSVSSVSLEDESPKMSHMDLRTREEIDLDLAKYPPLEPEVQDEIVQKYRLLNDRIKAEGLYQCRYSSYLVELIRYTILFGTCLYFLQRGGGASGWQASGWYLLSSIFLGLFWHQLVFSAHDAGHMGITHHFHVDTVIAILISDFMGGLSIGWWKRNHNVHHIVTNSPEHDPDIQHMPFFAVSHRFLDSLRSTYYDRIMAHDIISRTTIKFQDYLYYPILCFGRFNLYRLSWEYLLTGQAPKKGPSWWHSWLEIVGNVFFWSWFGYGILYRSIPNAFDRILFLMVSHMVTMPVHVQITLSHFAMSTSDLGVDESFPQKMLRTTMDVDCPEWLDFIHGGLQFQAIHHLYPRIPRHNLRRTQKLVQDFCQDVNIPYALYGFVDGNKQVIGRLGEVARQAAILAECQRTMAASKDFGLH